MNSGKLAEKMATEYLLVHGYELIDTNWRTRTCEIDVIVKRQGRVHFVEVKYRKNEEQGSGFEYITRSKLQQMAYAAEQWVNAHNWQGEYCLSAIELQGEAFEVSHFLDDLQGM